MKSKKVFLLFLLAFFCFSSSLLYTAPKSDTSFEEKTSPDESFIPHEGGKGYTVNFENLPILELIKFISKIGNVNFVYEEQDLAFNVTIVSEEPTGLVHIMAAFTQILRLNGFDLIEQGNTLVISKGSGVRQIATVVSAEVPLEGDLVPPIMTRVFRVKNANPATLAGLIGPLLSPNAIIEVSESTRHIIVTDITQNIEEIHKLFYSIDIPKSSLEIDSYTVRNSSPQDLISLANQILIPISEGNPLIFVPQNATNTIFIVSTPFLNEKSIAILEDLDSPPSLSRGIHGPLSSDNILIYHIQNKPADVMQSAVKDIKNNLTEMGPSAQNLVQALNSMKFVKQSHSLLFTGDARSLVEVKSILTSLDIPYSEEELEYIRGGFYIYKIKNSDEKQIARALEKLAQNLKKTPHPDNDLIEAIDSMKWIKESDSLIFTGDQRSLNRLKQILPTFDVPAHQTSKIPLSNDFFIYTPKNEKPQALLKQLQDTYTNLKNSNLTDVAFLQALNSAKISSAEGTITFTGDTGSLNRIRALVSMMDQPKGPRPEDMSTYIYRVKYVDPDYVEEGLKKIAKSVPSDEKLSRSLDNMKYISQSNSFVFRGATETINQIKGILPTLDNTDVAKESKSTYFVYKLINAPGNKVIKELDQTAKSIKGTDSEDKDLVESIHNIKWIQSTNSLVITGSSSTIDKLKILIGKFDNPRATEPTASSFYVYRPSGQLPKEFRSKILAAASEMSSSGLDDPELINALKSATLVSNDTAVMFTGTPAAIERVKVMVKTFENQEAGSQTTEYYIFKPQHQNPEAIIKQAKHAADGMKEGGLADPSLITALNSGTIVSKGTGVLFTGTADAINRLKDIIPTFDIPVEKVQKANEFYVYKPVHTSVDQLKQYAQVVANDMEGSGFADKSLISTLKNTRFVSNRNAVLFTGTESSIAKVRELLPSLDIPSEEQVKQVGKTTFVIYKIKHLTGPALMSYLRNMASDLKRAGSTQDDLLITLNNMRYVQDTNSIIFTGTPSAVQEAVALAQKFDIASLAQEAPVRAPSGYLIYKPKFVPGEELIKVLRDFEQNLMTSGVSDKNLFDVINNLKWMEKTSSVLISGDQEDAKKVYGLLERFDVPGPGVSESEPGIETVSDMSFLIYKLQYHSGSEIQDAIKLIGTDLAKIKTKVNDSLVDAIHTLQWIEVTNSLIATGQADALGKLKELIKSIDIPLKQVFVEVLVIETTMQNNLQFGLRWGSQGNYRNKFSYAGGGFPGLIGGEPDPLASFTSNLSSVTATNTPTGSFIPFSSGGDLGVIGDIILHKGQSYFALGSLINAIRDDGDTIIVMSQKLITQDNKMSTIFVGENIPYTGSFVQNQGQTTVQTSNLEYRDVGVSLSITPVVGNSDLITLMIEEDISEQVDTGDTTSTVSITGVQGITTRKSSTKTVVSVPDKSFLVISGSMSDSKVYHKTGIPCLGGLPLIGAAFSDNEKNDSISNLVIFVRPHIIKSFDVYKEITEKQEDLYRSQTVAEDFDAGLEMVKTPDDSY